jgi:hypothetical protein
VEEKKLRKIPGVAASERGGVQGGTSPCAARFGWDVKGTGLAEEDGKCAREGESPVCSAVEIGRSSSGWECRVKGGAIHRRLNRKDRPIEEKYREGKEKRTTGVE